MLTSKQIIKAIGCDKLKLWKGDGYWWFQYDDYNQTKRYDTLAVYVVTLKQLSLKEWVAEGKELVEKMENNLK